MLFEKFMNITQNDKKDSERNETSKDDKIASLLVSSYRLAVFRIIVAVLYYTNAISN